VPALVLELGLGFLLGNTLLPFSSIAPLEGVTQLGVLALFFQVGLEVRGDLLQSRRATIGKVVALSVLAPLLAFWPLRFAFQMATPTALVCLAVLCATGTGVTLRVLAQHQALQSPSGRLLVGVSVLDDLPAIGLLAFASASAGRALGPGGAPPAAAMALGLLLALASWQLVGRLQRLPALVPRGVASMLLVMIGAAWLGEVTGFTSLLGALWGGVLVARLSPPDQAVRHTLDLLSEVFLPLYFLSVGMRLPAAMLLEPRAWLLAAFLVLVALVSKWTCALGVSNRDERAGVDRWLVVYGLVPRGVPGLVFATTALAQGVIDPVQFAALLLMVTTTTVVGLLLLERRLLAEGPALQASGAEGNSRN
jgi:Kef-type K+ transport system membrane component KefB